MTTWAALFARQPRPGQVKTRLQRALSPQQAADLYAACLLDTATLLADCAATRKVVAYTGDCTGRALAALLAGCGTFDYRPQAAGSLGARMRDLFDASFAAGSQATVLIGTDSPSLPSTTIDAALRMLAAKEVVLGPSTDGGYYLLGLRRPLPALFSDDIAWGTGRVLEQTLCACRGRSLGLLPVWYDVDVPQDAAFLRAHLRALRRAGGDEGRHCLPVLETLPLPPPS